MAFLECLYWRICISLKNKKPNKKSANEDNTAEHDPIVALKRSLRDSLDTAFQLATLRGPLCSEPMFGLAFCIESIELSDSDRDRDTSKSAFEYPFSVRNYLSNLTGLSQSAYLGISIDRRNNLARPGSL